MPATMLCASIDIPATVLCACINLPAIVLCVSIDNSQWYQWQLPTTRCKRLLCGRGATYDPHSLSQVER